MCGLKGDSDVEFSKKQWQNIDSSVDINLEDLDFESLLSLNDYATKQEIKALYFPLIEMLSEKTRRHKECTFTIYYFLLNIVNIFFMSTRFFT